MNKAFFLDRDGVIVVETDYLSDPDQVELIPGTVEAIKAIHAAGYLSIVVSNQSGVARGYYDEADVAAVNRRIADLLAKQETAIDAFYHCPHHPDFSGSCNFTIKSYFSGTIILRAFGKTSKSIGEIPSDSPSVSR